MKSLYLTLLALILYNFGISQQIIDRSDNKKPSWYSGNSNIDSKDFQYFVSQGTSNSIDTARKAAIQNVILIYAQTLGTKYIVGSESKTIIDNSQSDGLVQTKTNFVFKGSVKGEEINFSIPCFTIVEYYWEKELHNGSPVYQYWILVRIPNREQDCNLPFYKNYGKSAVWRSAILPGWGQLFKKEKAKGTILLCATAVAVSGIFISNSMYTTNINNASETHDIKLIDAYLADADIWQTTRNISIVAAGAIYIYSLVDAMTAKGTKHYAWQTPRKVEFMPLISHKSVGVSLCLNF